MPPKKKHRKTFNHFILKAVDYLYANYRLLGFGSAVLTHDIEYGSYGTIRSTGGGRTMSVAAVMEVILTAMQLYEKGTGDKTVWDYLPRQSWENLGAKDIKAHLWVNSGLGSFGTADALRNFNMGGNVSYEELLPGSFINFRRSNGTSHAAVFMYYVDLYGRDSETWNESMIGFRYFSSQGRYEVGEGGLDFRIALFDTNDTKPSPLPVVEYRKDRGVIYSTDQHILNTGMMWHLREWGKINLML